MQLQLIEKEVHQTQRDWFKAPTHHLTRMRWGFFNIENVTLLPLPLKKHYWLPPITLP